MIGMLRGQLLRAEPDLVVLDVGGVGYQLRVPLSTFYVLDQKGLGTECVLEVHTHVRDDALELFGFQEAGEKQLFEKLIAVSGIGPRLALAILSGMPPADLSQAILNADVARLTRIPGVGKKTAERLVLELKDKMEGLGLAPAPAKAKARKSDLRQDVVAALVNLGYRERDAEQAVSSSSESNEASFQDLLREALAKLAR